MAVAWLIGDALWQGLAAIWNVEIRRDRRSHHRDTGALGPSGKWTCGESFWCWVRDIHSKEIKGRPATRMASRLEGIQSRCRCTVCGWRRA